MFKYLRSCFGGLLACLSFGGIAAESALIDEPQDRRATVVITIASRNGGTLLANLLVSLSKLRTNPRFSSVLSRASVPTAAEADCIAGARRDPSGHTFDIAMCLKVWPDLSSAPQPKLFEDTFSRPSLRLGAAAFPNVRVVPFEFELRVQTTQFSPFAGEKLTLGANGDLIATEPFRQVLCNSKITFIDETSCTVKVIPRLGIYQPDVYVPQKGYRVQVVESMSLEKAAAMRIALLKVLNLPKSTALGALRVSVLAAEPVHRQQLDVASKPKISTGTGTIAALWDSLGTKPDSLDISRVTDPAPPTILVFDRNDLSKPVSISEWLKGVFQATKESVASDCAAKIDDSNHSDAVASLLFPSMMSLDSKPKNESNKSAPISFPVSGWNGYFLSARHFSGAPVVEEAPWFQKKIFAALGQPIVGLVVFSSAYGQSSAGTAANAASTYLSEASNLLVVSAPQRSKVPAAPQFAPTAPTPFVDGDTLETVCQDHAWPACLGRHPRVLVVASADYPEAIKGGPALFRPTEYLLGASTVRISAPGGNIPVLARCSTSGASSNIPKKWQLTTESGTSFSAPLVAIVLTRLLQIGPDQLRIQLPEAAIWRVLATSRPLADTPSTPASRLAEFGRLDAGRALRGASKEEVGTDNYSVVYQKQGVKGEAVIKAVVAPFPWNDQPLNLTKKNLRYGIQEFGRNVITYTEVDTPGPKKETIRFDRVLRLMRRPGESSNGAPLFDIYFVTGIDDNKPFVSLKRRVRLGVSGGIDTPGFCRSDALATDGDASDNPLSQTQPSCLYSWSVGAKGFRPLNLEEVQDIVFPPLHYGSDFPGRVDPSDLTSVAKPKSPWAEVFCTTRPRLETRKLLTEVLKQPRREILCPA